MITYGCSRILLIELGGGYDNRGGGGENIPFHIPQPLLTTKTSIKAVAVANTTLEAVNLTVVVEVEAMTTSRVAAVEVAAGRPTMLEIPARSSLMHRHPRTRRTDNFADIFDERNGQEQMGGRYSVALMAFGSWFKDAFASIDPTSAPGLFLSSTLGSGLNLVISMHRRTQV